MSKYHDLEARQNALIKFFNSYETKEKTEQKVQQVNKKKQKERKKD